MPALVEGASSYRMQARVSPKLLARLEALPQVARDIAWKGNANAVGPARLRYLGTERCG